MPNSKRNGGQSAVAAIARKINPRRFDRLVNKRLMTNERPNGTVLSDINTIGAYSVNTGGQSTANGCCPDGAGGLPTARFAPVQFDECHGFFISNASTDYTKQLINYQRSRLVTFVWSITAAGATDLATNSTTESPVDGLMFFFPGTNGLSSNSFVTIKVKGYSIQKTNIFATATDYEEEFNLIPTSTQGPSIFGYVFRDANAEQVTLRVQKTYTITTAGADTITVPDQTVNVDVSGWVFAGSLGPIKVWPLNSATTWIAQYSARLDALI